MTESFTEVDIEAVCRRVLAEPRRARVSVIEQVAVCGRLLELIELARDDASSPLKNVFEKEFPNGSHD